MGAANEGEMPVVNQKVYYKNQYLSIDKNPQLFKVYGGTVNGYSYDRAEFITAVKFYSSNRSILQNDIAKSQASIDTVSNPVLSRILNEFYESIIAHINFYSSCIGPSAFSKLLL